METIAEHFHIYLDERTGTRLFGIEHGDGTRAPGFTTDAAEAERLARIYDQCALDPIHLADVLEDHCRAGLSV